MEQQKSSRTSILQPSKFYTPSHERTHSAPAEMDLPTYWRTTTPQTAKVCVLFHGIHIELSCELSSKTLSFNATLRWEK